MSRPLVVLGALVVGAALLAPAGWGQGRRQPLPPPSPEQVYDPDRATCEPEHLRAAVERQLQPYADQSPAVLAQLRTVQLDMVRRTLQRCVARELLTAEQATQLERELAASATRP